ncbi:glycine--tRNA ligase subunit beta, partial [Hydrogenophaga sp.]|uniref:glycine--tRNA ligase subunit beta n=1 Tax=Hydrogenophaga sp. TaxID=1904254 RepID=UPI003D0D75B0
KAVSQKLMPVSVGLDANGQPTPALLNRLAALGADASAVAGLKRAPDGKAEALFYDSVAPGAELAVGLQKALDEAIAKLPIPKVMTYQLADGWSDVKFVRPAHRLLALHGSTILGVSALGLQASSMTEGHRFECDPKAFAIREADSYAQQMKDQGAVIASFAERKAEIARQLAAAAAKVGNGAKPIEDDALLDEVTALVERPNVLICEFESQFLGVPQECLILTMKANQKYFPLLDAQGRLTNQFLVVSNITPDDPSAVIGGNERVVRPRLADAKFFFDQDRKKSLASRVEGLGKVVYHNKLGTQGERTERVRAIARAIGQQLGGDVLAKQADTAAQLAKTDLLTDMVGEFPELQGIMGGYYARHDGLSEDIAFAIEDHYRPRFAGDELPRNAVGTVVALADKLETLAGMFGIGNLPTGDKDPFALRRHALGVARMLIEGGLPLQFHELTRLAFSVFPNGALQDTVVQLDEFLIERLKGYLKDCDYSVAEVDAALYARQLGFWSTVPGRLAAVREFQALPEAPALAAANKRIGNILKKSEGVGEAVNPALFQEPAERALFDAMLATVPAADAKFEAGDFTASLQALAALRAPVDAFFDGVMVNADDPALKANRLGLLKQLHDAMNRVADLSRLAS